MFLLRAVLNILVRNASPRGPMCFRCLIFLVFIFALLYCLLDLRGGECNVVSLYVLCCPVNGSVCFVCCVFDSVCELFVETLSVHPSITPSKNTDSPSINNGTSKFNTNCFLTVNNDIIF